MKKNLSLMAFNMCNKLKAIVTPRMLLLLVLCTFILPDLHAQNGQSVIIKRTCSNVANKAIFAAYPSIDQIHVTFYGKKPSQLYLYFKPNASNSVTPNGSVSDKYDLEFEGDKYLFTKKYNDINIFLPPKKEIEYMAGMQRCTAAYDIQAIIYRDSITYEFRQACNSNEIDNKKSLQRTGNGARYDCDIHQLSKTFEIKYSHWTNGPVTDSVFIFKAFVDKTIHSELSDVKLVEGVKSSLSDFIQEELEKTGKCWYPALMGGRVIKSYITIYVRLNKNKSFTISTSRKYL